MSSTVKRLEGRCGEVSLLGDVATQLAVARAVVVVDEDVRIKHVGILAVVVGVRGVAPRDEHRLQTLQHGVLS